MAHKKKHHPKKVKWYKHLTVFERAFIEQKRREGLAPPKIAKLMRRNRSTIIRELARNSPPKTKRYRAEPAHARAFERRAKRGIRPRLKNERTRNYVIEKLKLGWSPEQIAIRLPIDHPGQTISAEAIYQFVYAQVRRDGSGKVKKGGEDSRLYLARRHRRREKKGFRATRKLYQTPLPSIENRPAVVKRRRQFGHWEDDTMVSRQSSDRVKSINERVSGVVLLGKMKDGSIAESNRVVIERLSSLPFHIRKTLTRDRGTENLGYVELERELNLTCYFAHAYCSQERGSNENLNGLVRRVYPKKTDWRFVTDVDLRQLEYRLNTRPRKRHGGKTPLEVLFERTGCALTY
ncbi:MAG TPA: IS30 family transposase [Candidatus Paceibacterota bacterium]